jgi:hypothetical protein
MNECKFCGIHAEKGSNELREFACLDCLKEVCYMLPPVKTIG